MSKGALLFPLLLFYSCVTSAQDSDFNVSWGDTYSRTATQDAHFLYMGTWGGETYIRTGNDREQFLHRLSHRLRVVQTIALDQEFRGHSMYFERLIETPAGSHNPKDHYRLVRISPGSGEEVLPLELGNGRVPTSIDLIWNPTQQQYHVVGLFTDGTEPSNLGGFYTAILKAGTVSQAQTMAFSDEFRSQEIAHLDKLKDDLRSKVVSKPINTGKRLGEDYRVKASKFDSNGNLSCWLERHTTRKYTDTAEPEKDGASLFVRMDPTGKPITARIFSRFFVAQGNQFPTSLRWYEGEDLHVIYPNITTVEAQQELGGRSKGGGTLEYLVLGPDGETLRSEILMSGLSSFYDFNFPLARYESCVLFGELSPSKYKLGCTDEWE